MAARRLKPAKHGLQALRLECLEERRLLAVTPWSGLARDAQHTGQSTVAGQSLDVIHWETPVDLAPQYTGNDLLIHYGSPVITALNTVIVPEKNETTGGFDLNAFDGTTGGLKWTQTQGEEFVAPPHDWTPSYVPALAALPGGLRLYFAGADGTIFYRDAPDGTGATTPGRIVFYGTANYAANPAAFAGVTISSPLTTDSAGNLYFSYQVNGSNPLNLQSGIARIGADGSTSYAQVGTPALDSAPAVSNDGTKLYVAINGQLVEYNSATLAPLANVQLGSVNIDSSASPTIGPDGDIFFGVLSPFDHDRGSLEHFSADLATTYTPGSFGWDDTVSIVPASMVPSYAGPSSYLLMTKYNDYAGVGGTGINKIAIVDPKSTQIDAVTGRLAMTTVLSIAGVTPDADFPGNPNAVREWCINNAVVDPITHSIFANSEDGWLYRWDTTSNTFTQRIRLTSGVGEAYTPTVIGADGTVYAINNAILFAVGQTPTLTINDVSLVEGNSGVTNAVFTVSLSSSSTVPVIVAYFTANQTATAGTDYQATSGTLTFAPAAGFSGGATAQTISVPIFGDTQIEPNETFLVNLANPINATIARAQAVGTIRNDDAAIAGRFLFYDNSHYDGNMPGVSSSDDLAIATDKTAYLPNTGVASFANVSSYSRGINGLMVDIVGGHGSIAATDFTFKVGNNNAPTGWSLAPAPTAVVVRAGAGVGGSDRVELVWPDNAIRKTWLEVVIAADANTGLAVPDTFFFANAIADSGLNDTTTAKTDVFDELGARGHATTAFQHIPLTNPYDFNRDGKVDIFDDLLARGNATSALTAPIFIQVGIPLVAATAVPGDTDLGLASGLSRAATTISAPSADSGSPPIISIDFREPRQVARKVATESGDSSSDALLVSAHLVASDSVSELDDDLLEQIVTGHDLS